MLRDRGASEAEWRLCALEIEDEVPLSPREPQSAGSGLAIPRVGRGHFSYSACVTHEVLQSVCRHDFLDPVVMTRMRHSALRLGRARAGTRERGRVPGVRRLTGPAARQGEAVALGKSLCRRARCRVACRRWCETAGATQ